MKHVVVIRYPLDESDSAVMDEGEIAFVGHSQQEVVEYLDKCGAKEDYVSFVSTRNDRPGDWEDAIHNKTHAFEIKEEV